MTRPLSLGSQLANARADLRHAQQACPHWDYESDGDAGHECCIALDAAERTIHELRNRMENQ